MVGLIILIIIMIIKNEIKDNILVFFSILVYKKWYFIIIKSSYKNSTFFNSLKTVGNFSLFLFTIVLLYYLNRIFSLDINAIIIKIK